MSSVWHESHSSKFNLEVGPGVGLGEKKLSRIQLNDDDGSVGLFESFISFATKEGILIKRN